MKEGWEYRKFADVIQEYSVKNKDEIDYPVYSVTNSQGFCRDYFNKDVSSKDKSNYKIVPRGYFAYNPSRINVGSIDYQRDEDYVIVSPLYNIFSVSKSMIQPFVLYYMKSRTLMKYIKTFAEGTVRSNLKINILKTFPIPVPPLSVQQHIVAELDLLSGIIEKQKKQLLELDNLAQSIFYQMFGNPVENEMGWEVKKLGDICDIFAGGDKPKNLSKVQTEEYLYPVIANGEGDKGVLGFSKSCRVQKTAVTLGARGASIGNCRIVKQGFTPAIRLITLVPNGDMDCCFLFFIIKGMNYNINGAGQAQLTVPNIKSEYCPVPPLLLQQQFATKIQSIEHQKQLIKSSLHETETLFNARMDYYFN